MTTARVSETLGLLAFAVIASPIAVAADLGGYIGGNIGRSKAHFDEADIAARVRAPGPVTTSIASDDEDRGYKLFGGYQFHRNFAVEAGYFNLGDFNFTATTVPPGTQTGEMKVRGLNVDLVGSLPITEKFSAFGRVGATYARTKGTFAGTGAVIVTNPSPSDRDLNYKFGAGLQYDFTPRFGIRAEAERYRVSDAVSGRDNVDLFSVGLVWRFGARTPPPPPPVQRAPEPAPVVVPPPPPKKVVTPPPPPRVETPPPAPPPPAPVEKPVRRDRN